MANCSQCQGELPEQTESGRCPHCGHAWAVVHLDGVGILDSVVTEIGYGIEKSWLEQWGVVERSYSKLQELYSIAVDDNQVAQSVVKDFFIHSWHLIDWLDKDPSIAVTGGQVWSFVKREPDLLAGRAMANTSKHHTLKDPNDMTARVKSVVLQPHGKATLEIHATAEAEPYTRDALELADSCMSAWRRFLSERGLKV
jgi:hypothetical protein